MQNSLPIRVVKVGGSLLNFGQLPDTLQRWLATQPPAHNVLIAGGGKLADEIRAADVRFTLGELAAHWICIDLLDITAKLLAQILPAAPLLDSLAELQQLTSSSTTPLESEVPLLAGTAVPTVPNARNPETELGSNNLVPGDSASLSLRMTKNPHDSIPTRKIVDTIAKKGYASWIFSPSRFLREQEQHLPGVVLPHGWLVTSDSIAARIAETLGAEELVLLKSTDPPPSKLGNTGYVDEHFEQARKNLALVRFVNLRKF